MKNRWMNKKLGVAIFLLCVNFLILQASCFLIEKSNDGKGGAEVDIYELSLDDNLQTPIVPQNLKSKIKQVQFNNAVELKKLNYNVEFIRDKEIVVVTIQAGQIFNPNDTIVSDLGKVMLNPFKRFLEKEGEYKMLLVMHGDNSGSEKYILSLTRARVNAIYDWFEENATVDYVVPYALGMSDPIKDNSTIAKRRQNRRLEIFIIPNQKLITSK